MVLLALEFQELVMCVPDGCVEKGPILSCSVHTLREQDWSFSDYIDDFTKGNCISVFCYVRYIDYYSE